MKKQLAIFLIGLFCLIFLAACHDDKSEQVSVPSSSPNVIIDYEIPESSSNIIDFVPED